MTMREHPEPWTEEDARNFRAWRERRQRSQRVCALLMGYSISTVRAWEHGRRKPSQAARWRIQSEFADPRGVTERLYGIRRTPARSTPPDSDKAAVESLLAVLAGLATDTPAPAPPSVELSQPEVSRRLGPAGHEH